jgi:small GTP-binding protein
MSNQSRLDQAEGVILGAEPTPGVRLRCICKSGFGAIGRIAWSPCGRFIASPFLSHHGVVCIWDAMSGNLHRIISGHQYAVYAVAWAPDGERIASAGNDMTVRIWNANTGEQLKCLNRFQSEAISIAWSPFEDQLAVGYTDDRVRVWDTNTWRVKRTLRHKSQVTAVTWAMHYPGETRNRLCLITVSRDKHVRFWGTEGRNPIRSCFTGVPLSDVVLLSNNRGILCCGSTNEILMLNERASHCGDWEAHTRRVNALSVSSDGEIVASKGSDGRVMLWKTDSQELVAAISETTCHGWPPNLAFHPRSPILATLGENDTVVRVWDITKERLLTDNRVNTVHHLSAKIAIIGDSNIGKSCLSMRLAEDRYPDDDEQGTTHGMRFWPMDASDLHRSTRSLLAERREVVLWDFGGQDEYQLVHQMFIHDTALALILIDPTRGNSAFSEARNWNRRLDKHLGKNKAVKILVGAKQDRKSSLIDSVGLKTLIEECGFASYVDVSARTGRRIDDLKKIIAESLDWERMAKSSRPELLQRIRDEVEQLKESGIVVLMQEVLIESLRDLSTTFELDGTLKYLVNYGTESQPVYIDLHDAARSVINQLALQGVIVQTRRLNGDKAVILQLPVIERYAGSLLIAARESTHGVPSIEERALGQLLDFDFPGIPADDRMAIESEQIIIECVIELMIEHGLCFRHSGQLVFPSLFPSGQGQRKATSHSASLYYDFTGAIDNIYASLISRLMVGGQFGQGRLEPDSAEFDRPGKGVCGIRQIKRSAGLAHIDLYFADRVDQERRDLFTQFVEEHLRQEGVDIQEHQEITCRCGELISERIIQARIAAGETHVICPICETRTRFSDGVAQIRDRAPDSHCNIIALRQRIQEEVANEISTAKRAVSMLDRPSSILPTRILHLSDLHFEKDTDPKVSLQALLQDLRSNDVNFPRIEKVEYLVLSGDVTHHGDEMGFEIAREFVDDLIEHLGLSSLRCILVPGNHDIQRLDSSYGLRSDVRSLDPSTFVKKADVYLVRNDSEYQNRLRQFSDAFYHKVTSSSPYPLSPKEQGMASLFTDKRIQFISLNTAWEIDQFHPDRATVHPGSLARAIEAADTQISKAVEKGGLNQNDYVLRIAVFHHAVHGPWAMQNLDFVSVLKAANVKLCMHGDVHEMRIEWINHWDSGCGLKVLGSGAFGAKTDAISEGNARSYNVIEIREDLRSARVYVREQPRLNGAWRGWNHFSDPDGGRGSVPFWDLDFK